MERNFAMRSLLFQKNIKKIEVKKLRTWYVIKNEIIVALYATNDTLAKYQNQPNIMTSRAFATKVLHLYHMIRAKLYLLEDVDKRGRYKGLKKMLDPVIISPPYPEMRVWIHLFYTIEEAIEELGITKIEFKKEREYPPEEAWKESIPEINFDESDIG